MTATRNVLPVRLSLDRGTWLWKCGRCPFSGREHTHGGGNSKGDPRDFLSHRAPHCGLESDDYCLVDLDPSHTTALIARYRAGQSLRPTPGLPRTVTTQR